LRPSLAFESGEQALLRLRADAGHSLKSSLACGGTELVGARHAERAPDLDHPLRCDAKEASQPNELGLYLALELVELRDVSGLDQLA
jgi:hypothetical protein